MTDSKKQRPAERQRRRATGVRGTTGGGARRARRGAPASRTAKMRPGPAPTVWPSDRGDRAIHGVGWSRQAALAWCRSAWVVIDHWLTRHGVKRTPDREDGVDADAEPTARRGTPARASGNSRKASGWKARVAPHSHPASDHRPRVPARSAYSARPRASMSSGCPHMVTTRKTSAASEQDEHDAMAPGDAELLGHGVEGQEAHGADQQDHRTEYQPGGGTGAAELGQGLGQVQMLGDQPAPVRGARRSPER